MKQSNIRNYERISANILHIIEILKLYLKFRKVYLNSSQAFVGFLNGNKTKVVFKNKKSFTLSARAISLMAILCKQGIKLDYENDKITIEKKSGFISGKEKVIFHNGIENGDIYHVFTKNEYNKLKVKGKTVVDIGANIGDSLIYFALKDAKKVIGFEPFHNNFHFAKKNIEENDLEEKCEINLAGCGEPGSIKLDPNMKGDVDSKLENFNDGNEVPRYSLQQIIKNFNIPQNSILKMDCEGCEYESILTASDKTLNTFDEILIEYHHGYLDLEKRLKKCGFKVSSDSPTSTGFIGKYMKIFMLKRNNFLKKHDKNDVSHNNTLKNDFNPGYSGLIYAIKYN